MSRLGVPIPPIQLLARWWQQEAALCELKSFPSDFRQALHDELQSLASAPVPRLAPSLPPLSSPLLPPPSLMCYDLGAVRCNVSADRHTSSPLTSGGQAVVGSPA